MKKIALAPNNKVGASFTKGDENALGTLLFLSLFRFQNLFGFTQINNLVLSLGLTYIDNLVLYNLDYTTSKYLNIYEDYKILSIKKAISLLNNDY